MTIDLNFDPVAARSYSIFLTKNVETYPNYFFKTPKTMYFPDERNGNFVVVVVHIMEKDRKWNYTWVERELNSHKLHPGEEITVQGVDISY